MIKIGLEGSWKVSIATQRLWLACEVLLRFCRYEELEIKLEAALRSLLKDYWRETSVFHIRPSDGSHGDDKRFLHELADRLLKDENLALHDYSQVAEWLLGDRKPDDPYPAERAMALGIKQGRKGKPISVNSFYTYIRGGNRAFAAVKTLQAKAVAEANRDLNAAELEEIVTESPDALPVWLPTKKPPEL